MTRKYRGKTKDGEWVYGWYCEIEERHFIIPATASLCYGVKIISKHDFIEGFVEVVPSTVGQETGKKDMNGKDMYEGDRVVWYAEELTSKCEVFWQPEFSGLMLRQKGSFRAWHFYEDMKIEIIGNIHEKESKCTD